MLFLLFWQRAALYFLSITRHDYLLLFTREIFFHKPEDFKYKIEDLSGKTLRVLIDINAIKKRPHGRSLNSFYYCTANSA